MSSFSSFTNVFIVSLALLATACGSSDPASSAPERSATGASAPAGTPRDACTLLTAEEVGKILGSPAKAIPRSTGADRSTCDYVTEAYESFSLEATWTGAEDAIGVARRAAAVATSAAGGSGDATVNEVMGSQRVENLGEEAYFSRRGVSHVRKGDVLLSFQTAGLNDPAREHWEALARIALGRL